MWRQTGENVTMTGGRQLSIGRRNTRIKCNAIPLAQQYKRISFFAHGHKMTVFLTDPSIRVYIMYSH